MVAAAVVGGVVNYNASKKGAKAQTDAANQANETERYIYDQTREDQMPWQQAGRTGLNSLMGLYGYEKRRGNWQRSANPSATANSFMTMDPGYQFRLREGQRNLENSAAARGGLMSGNFLKATTKYGQDYGANEFANIANRYGQLAGVGQVANQSLQSAGQNYANAYGQNVQNAGAARASGYAGRANAITGAINGPKNDALYLAGLTFGGR